MPNKSKKELNKNKEIKKGNFFFSSPKRKKTSLKYCFKEFKIVICLSVNKCFFLVQFRNKGYYSTPILLGHIYFYHQI